MGTAFARPDEPEPTSGRLLIFSVTERTLELKHELSTAGAVYALEAFNGKLLAGVNNKLQLYEWMPCARAPRLQLRHEHCGHILVLYVQVHRHSEYCHNSVRILVLYVQMYLLLAMLTMAILIHNSERILVLRVQSPTPNPNPDPDPHQSRGDFILVGDLMKSVSLLQCTAASGELKELSRDFNANWMTAVSFLDDDTFLGAENWCRLSTP